MLATTRGSRAIGDRGTSAHTTQACNGHEIFIFDVFLLLGGGHQRKQWGSNHTGTASGCGLSSAAAEMARQCDEHWGQWAWHMLQQPAPCAMPGRPDAGRLDAAAAAARLFNHPPALESGCRSIHSLCGLSGLQTHTSTRCYCIQASGLSVGVQEGQLQRPPVHVHWQVGPPTSGYATLRNTPRGR